MHKITVEAPGLTIGSGEVLALTAAQLETRIHRVEQLDEKPKGDTVRVRVIEPVQFKAGEVILAERAPKGESGTPAAAKPPAAPKREKRDANGDTPEMAQLRSRFDASYEQQSKELEAAKAGLQQAREEGIKAGRAEMLKEIEERNLVFESAEAAAEAVESLSGKLKAETAADKHAELEKQLEAAKALQAEADAKVEALPELKA